MAISITATTAPAMLPINATGGASSWGRSVDEVASVDVVSSKVMEATVGMVIGVLEATVGVVDDVLEATVGMVNGVLEATVGMVNGVLAIHI